MTTTTVEVERTVTESEELVVCDDCQRELDDDGHTFITQAAVEDFIKNKRGHHILQPNEDLSEYVDDSWNTMHFCTECEAKISGGDPAYVERAADWLDEADRFDDTVRGRAESAHRKVAGSFKWVSLIGVALLVATFLPMAPTIPMFVYTLYTVVCFLGVWAGVANIAAVNRTIGRVDDE